MPDKCAIFGCNNDQVGQKVYRSILYLLKVLTNLRNENDEKSGSTSQNLSVLIGSPRSTWLCAQNKSISSLSCKAIYSVLLNLEDLPPPTSEKKLLASCAEKSDLTKIYLLPFKATREIKLTMF